jgi:ABC-2 type transport system permease protein
MLWQKAWLESRARFLISASVLIGVCLTLVFMHSTLRARIGATGPPLNTYVGYIHKSVYGGGARPLCTILVLILGLGGLLHEREQGTAAFTLALPVRRWRLVAVRAAVGLVEMTALAMIPALLIPTMSPIVHQSYPFSQAIQFSLLWIAVGTILFATSFLLSTVLAGQYTAFLVAWILFILHTLVAAYRPFRMYRFNLNWVQSGFGMPYFDPRTATLIGPMPWTRLSIMLLVSLVLLAAAARITERQEY